MNYTKDPKEAERFLDKISARTSLGSQEQALDAVNKILEEFAIHGNFDQKEQLDYQLAKDLHIEPFSLIELNKLES